MLNLTTGVNLVLRRGGLASLELLEVPSADLHVALVLVEALSEVLGLVRAVSSAVLRVVVRLLAVLLEAVV